MKPKKLTKDEHLEAVLRGEYAARAGFSIYANPYDEQRQREQWNVWRFTYVDASPEPGVELPTFVTPEQIQRSYREAYDALIAAGATPGWKKSAE